MKTKINSLFNQANTIVHSKIVTLIAILLLTGSLFAQVPDKVNYQAVIRDAGGNALANSPINIRFQLFDQIIAGTQLYQEDFNTTTNAYGVVNIALGTAPVFGNLKTLNWGANSFYVNIQMGNPLADIANSRTQLISVPYALHAAKSDTAAYALSSSQVTYTAGSGININGVQISNTAPDQPVTLAAGTGISVSGNYPSFNLTNTAPDQSVSLTAGTGVSVSGTYPSFNLTNTAPDQPVSLTAGTGISVSGTYPSFTVNNTAPNQPVTITSSNGLTVTGTYPNFTIALAQASATPVGTIFAYGGSTVPAGWLPCDGQSYINSIYPDLAAAIGTNFGGTGSTFNVPDLRGMFLRGVDGVAGRDPDKASRTAMASGGQTGNNVGSVQEDDFEAHQHIYSRNGSGNYPTGSSGSIPTGFQVNANTALTGGAETRPKNVYVNYIIKY